MASSRSYRRAKAARRRAPFFSTATLLTMAAFGPSLSCAIEVTAAPPANLDFSHLGRIGIAGDFTGISLYEYEGQESALSTNDSQSLLTQLPNGAFASVASTDASIRSMCAYTQNKGEVAGVIIGGNFTSLDGERSQAIALFNHETGEVTRLDGLEGQVNAVYCDQETDMVYIGGNFKGQDSTNAIAWNPDDSWVKLPFSGFNGPVASITRASNGHIIFGGSFTGLGNMSTPSNPDEQVINLSDADISDGSGSTLDGFSDPRNIICKTDGVDGPGNTWLLADNSPGFWQADFGFGFHPTKLRLYNTHQDGRGTKTWRFTVIPDNGILNFTYINPATGRNESCTNQCPLSDDPDVPFQDFHFVNYIGMSTFRIDISEFYGLGGGLNGIELFGDDIFAYAINRFNEPSCAGLGTGATAEVNGPWEQSPSTQSSSRYLTTRLSSPFSEDSNPSIVFFPDIKESGNYSVNMYTPGCIGDGTCGFRGQVNVTGIMSRDNTVSFVTTLFQTNNFDKYDQIYFGFIDASSPSFRPSVTITPLEDQSMSEMVFVAQRVGFTLINSTGGLNGIFDYDPESSDIDVDDFKASAINQLGFDLSGGSKVTSLATSGDVLFVGGDFTASDAENVISINSESERISSLDGGLDGAVTAMQLVDSKLYVGGDFSKTRGNDVNGLSNVAVYDTEKNSWGALGAGVNGKVRHVVPMKVILAEDATETVIAFSGDFTECLGFDKNPATDVAGLVVWVPSKNNWLHNLDQAVPGYAGFLTASLLDLPDDEGSLYAGSLAASQVSATGAATLTDGTLGRFPVNILSESAADSESDGTSSKLRRRQLLSDDDDLSGVSTGAFYESDGQVTTILVGRFTAETSNGSTIDNLVIIDGDDGEDISGLGSGVEPNSTYLAIAVEGDILYAGGLVSGDVNGDQVRGIVSYNLASRTFPDQPPAISGGNSSVSSIAIQPNSGAIFVGGSFTQGGSLPCPGVCIYNAGQNQWEQPGVSFEGDVSCMIWVSEIELVVGGSVTVNGTVNTPLAIYHSDRQSWDSYPGKDDLPGPVETMTSGSSDGKQLWVSGHAEDGSVFLMKYDGSRWLSAPKGVSGDSVITSMQIFSLTEGHGETDLLPDRQSLVLTGSISLDGFGTASAVIFDGESFRPYALTNSGNRGGSISKIFSQRQDFFTLSEGNMPLVFVVLIGLAISLGLMLILIAAGFFLDRYRKKREGYVPAPTSMIDRGSGIKRVPPGQLFESLGTGRPGVPQV